MSETARVVALIREIECHRLGNWDGCCCSNFSIRNVDVEIACGKSSQPAGAWVSSRSMDYSDEADLLPILEEVLRQVVEQSGRRGPFKGHINDRLVCERGPDEGEAA